MDIVRRSWDVQERIEDKFKGIGKGKYGRVLKMARKPDRDEYSKTLKVTGAGMAIIGGLGFLIWLLWNKIPEYIASLR
ncbi:MAG: protein translocase SEC61 complex subunit gamma [Thermoplasmata archaeon]|nr:MAG: protein translocase SEC61 complex subunit gamma [Thermoplasmata archaeon]